MIHATESAVKQHPAYKAAKSGDDDAATDLVVDTFSLEQTHVLEKLLRERTPTEFQGPVKAGCEYVLVDDFVGMGGTLANLKGHIESNGGRVVAAVTLTGKPYSAKLTPLPQTLQALREKHGTELENWWIGHFTHTFDALTESEARYLTRTETADAIRDRIAAAEQAGDGAALS